MKYIFGFLFFSISRLLYFFIFLFFCEATSQFCIALEDILAASSHTGPPAKDKICKFNGDYKAIEMQPLHSLAFKVCVVKHAKKHKWRTKELIFTCKDHATSSQWIEKIKEVLYGPGKINFSTKMGDESISVCISIK